MTIATMTPSAMAMPNDAGMPVLVTMKSTPAPANCARVWALRPVCAVIRWASSSGVTPAFARARTNELVALGGRDGDRVGELHVADGQAGEGGQGVRQRGDGDAVVVDLDDFADRIAAVLPDAANERAIEDERIAAPDRLGCGGPIVRRQANKARIVDADQGQRVDRPIGRFERGRRAKVRHGPVHAIDRPHPIKLGVADREPLLGLADSLVHDPHLGFAHVQDRVRTPCQKASKNRNLLCHEQGGEGNPEDQAEILHPIAHQHFQGHAQHRKSSQRAAT